METKVYKGFIRIVDEYGPGDGLYLSDYEEPLAKTLEYDIWRKQVTIRYWVSDIEKSKAELQEDHLRVLFGDLEAEHHDHYSEITGYLWTDEELKVGGHDLLAELESHEGKYLYMEIEIHQ